MKLKDAKCPNCGANIEVNEKLEKSICQYCGSTVMVEEAIEKYKVEISGKVEVEGIKGRSSKLKQAKKHIALNEYPEARTILSGLVQEDRFDVEAYIELLKMDINDLKNMEFNPNSSYYSAKDAWMLVDEVEMFYTRIYKIDEDNIADKGLKDYKEDIELFIGAKEKMKKDDKELAKIVVALNEHLASVRAIDKECERSWFELLEEWLNIPEIGELSYRVKGVKNFSKYNLVSFKSLSRDGYLESRYIKIDRSNDYTINPDDTYLYKIPSEPITCEELVESFKNFDEATKQYIRKCTEYKNGEIDKENKKIDKQNQLTGMKSKFKYGIMIALCAWVLLLGIGTIVTLFDSFGKGIAMILLLDSWLMVIPIRWILAIKEGIKSDKYLQQVRESSKRDHL